MRWLGRTLSSRARGIARRIVDPIAAALARTPVTPNALTVLALLLNAGVAAVLASGQLGLGGVLLLVASAFDLLDGALARFTARTTTFGAFLDSTLDRYSEAIVLFGLLIHFARSGAVAEILLVYAVFVGSVLVSYARARAEGLGIGGEVGWLARPERIILLAAGLILGWVSLALWILAILTHVTVVQRMVFVYRRSQWAVGSGQWAAGSDQQEPPPIADKEPAEK